MKRRPLDHKTRYPGRQPSRKHRESANIYQSKLTAILRMKMRWVVIVKEHLDNDAEETTDLRHGRAGGVAREKCLQVSCPLP